MRQGARGEWRAGRDSTGDVCVATGGEGGGLGSGLPTGPLAAWDR